MIPSGSTPFTHMAAHNDILLASPSTLADKLALVEEVKFRCKGMIKSKHYGDAEVLYTKAIEVLSTTENGESKDLAILYSNRSLTRTMIHKYNLAIEDAQASIEHDGSYAKGYWRLGAAYAGFEKYIDAVESYTRGLSIVGEKEEKIWKKEIERCRSKISNDTKSSSVENRKSTPAPIPKKREVSTSSSTSSKNKDMDVDEVINDDSNLFTKSDKVRGYKVVNGKKTSYFHHEQTEEEKRLIGDIAPKKIEATPTPVVVDAPTNTSAWNKAGTWEEKDYTNSAKDLLTNSLLQSQYNITVADSSSFDSDFEGGVAKVTKVRDIDGHASIATVRGKRRVIYEFSFVIDWLITLGNGDEISGSVKYPDVDGTTCVDEDDLVCSDFKTQDSCDDLNLKKLADKFVRRNGLRDEVNKRIIAWSKSWHSTL